MNGAQQGEDYEDIEWSSYADVVLLNSLVGLRPVGINYPICMMAVWNRFTLAIAKNVSMDCVEKRLEKFYDFEAANGIVDENPFLNQHQDFFLPEKDFPEMTEIKKERDATPVLKKTAKSSLSTDSGKNLIAKVTKRAEPKSSEKPKKNDDDKKTPAKKRGRGSEKSVTPAAKKGRI